MTPVPVIHHSDPDSSMIGAILKTLTRVPSVALITTLPVGKTAVRMSQAGLVSEKEMTQLELFPSGYLVFEITPNGRAHLTASRTLAKWLRSKKRRALHAEWLKSGDPLVPFHVHLKYLPKTPKDPQSTMKKTTKPPEPAPTTHDYTQRYWGHDYVITDVHNEGQRLSMCGWGRGIKAGDYILLVSMRRPGENPSTRYQVDSIEYYNDPADMWRMEASFAPRPQGTATA
jgi:hypothetical protein